MFRRRFYEACIVAGIFFLSFSMLLYWQLWEKIIRLLFISNYKISFAFGMVLILYGFLGIYRKKRRSKEK